MSTSDFALAVVVPVSSDSDVAAAARQFVVPEGIAAKLYFVDITPGGIIGSSPNGTVYRGATHVLSDALAALSGEPDRPVILRRADAAYDLPSCAPFTSTSRNMTTPTFSPAT